MLFAIDIDGTIATSGQYFCLRMFNQAGIALSEEELARLTYGYEFWHHPLVEMLPEERRAELKAFSRAHHKDLDLLANSVPIPGAAAALHSIGAEGGRIIYTTCRPLEAQQLTRDWLVRYGFPSPEQVYICEKYHSKYIHAQAQAKEKEPVVLIDDLVEKMVPAFVFLVKHHRETAISLVKRLAVVEIGREEPRTFPYTVPFPVLALPSWQAEHLGQLQKAS